MSDCGPTLTNGELLEDYLLTTAKAGKHDEAFVYRIHICYPSGQQEKPNRKLKLKRLRVAANSPRNIPGPEISYNSHSTRICHTQC